MRSLYLRELKRCAPFALGLIAAAGVYAAAVAPQPSGAFDILFKALLVLPALLGVINVAPDTSSGGVAFLARLPLSPARVMTAKVGAALTWWVPCLLLAGWASPLVPPSVGLLGWVAWLQAYGAFAYGSGLLASVVVARALPAVLVTPSLAIGGLLVGAGLPLLVWGIPLGPFSAVSSGVLGVAFVGVAGLAYAHGDRHRRSFRPALIALGALAPLCVAGLGLTAAAHAWTVERVVPSLAVGPTPGVASPDGRLLAVSLEGECWTGRERRVAVVPRAGGRAWVPDVRDAVEPQFSPDSQHLVVRDARDPGGWLVDLETHAVRELTGAAPEGIGFEHALWRDGVPFFVRDRGGWLEGFDPTEPCDFDPRQPQATTARLQDIAPWRLLGTRGSRLVLAHPERGLVEAESERGPGNPCGLRVDLERATPLAGWSSEGAATFVRGIPQARLVDGVARGMVSVGELLAPDAGHALALPVDLAGNHTRVLLCDLEAGTQRWLETGVDGVRLEETRVSWSPRRKYVAIELPSGRIGVFDLRTGERLTELASSRPRDAEAQVTARVYRHGPVVWSPQGTKLSTPAGLLVDLEPGAEAAPASDPGVYVGDRQGGDRAFPRREVKVGDRYFVSNHEGVVFYTSAPTFELCEADPGAAPAHVCKGPEACYDPVGIHGEAYRYVLEEREARRRGLAGAALDSRLSEPDDPGELAIGPDPDVSPSEVVPATAAFLDGHTVIRLFEPLSSASLRGHDVSLLLKGGE